MDEPIKPPMHINVSVKATAWTVTVTDGTNTTVMDFPDGTPHVVADAALKAHKAKFGITGHDSVAISV